MPFEESALTRLRRYRDEADRSLGLAREAEEKARTFSERLFTGLTYCAVLANEAGFETATERTDDLFAVRVSAGARTHARLALAVVPGAAAETEEDLMHEDLSRYDLDPSGYSGRILGWSEAASDAPCQTFAVYRDGVWKTRGLFVAKARGRVDDPDDVLNGFCLRILGRLVDVAALTGGAARAWTAEPYELAGFLSGEAAPTRTRWPG